METKGLMALLWTLLLFLSSLNFAGEITGVSIQQYSSQLGWGDRDPIHTIDASGLDVNGPGTHTIWPDGTVWMSGWNAVIANQFIVYDLGAFYEVNKMRVWNCNSWDATTTGVDEFELLLSKDNISYVSMGTFNLLEAPMSDGVDYSQVITWNAGDTYRYVKFDVNSNHGYVETVGLSEVRFFENITGFTLEELATFVSRWLNSDCSTWNNWCSGSDLNQSFNINLTDFSLLPTPGLFVPDKFELVTNGSFEQFSNGNPTGWDYTDDPANGVTVTLDADTGRNSPQSIKIDCTAYPSPANVTSTSHADIFQQGIPFLQGELYHLSFWVKAINVENNTVRVSIYDTSDWLYSPLQEYLPVTDVWQKFTFDIYSVQDISSDDSLLWFTLDEVGTLWLDDVTIMGPNAVVSRFQPRIASIGSKNLLPNSSFECGTAGWSSLGQVTGWGGDLSGLYGEIESGGAWDGSDCLRIDMGPATPVTYSDSWPPDQDVQHSPLAANIGWVRVSKGSAYTLSTYMRTDTPGVKASLLFRHGGTPPNGISTDSSMVTLTNQWQRYTITRTALEDDLCIAVGPDMSSMPAGSAVFWIDAVQLEKSVSATPYSPREQVEISINTNKHGNIFNATDPVVFEVCGRNTSTGAVNANVNVQLEDYFGILLPEQTLPLAIPASSRTSANLPLNISGKGFYRARVSWQADGLDHYQVIKFAVIEPYGSSDSPYGVNHAPTTPEQCELLLRSGVTWARNWAQNWEWAEPVQGQISFDSLDGHIDRVLDTGMNILSLLPSNPSTNWASEAPPEVPATMWHRLAYAPTNPQWLYDFITQAVNRYKNRATYWEFLNEPLWVPDFCLPLSAGYTVNDYITLLQGAYSAMKAADPTCTVVGGLSIQAEMTLGDDFINAGGLNYVDIYNIHPYPGFNAPEFFIPHMERILAVMDANGGRKPMWATETSYYGVDDLPWIPWVTPPGWAAQWLLESERMCSDYSTRFSVIMLAHGVEKIFWHQPLNGTVNNGYWNMSNNLLAEESVPRKFYPAQAALANMLGSAPVYAGQMDFPLSTFGSDVNKLYGYAFQCAGKAVLVAWSSPVTVDKGPLNLTPGVDVFDIMGNPVSQLSAFGSSPIYLVSTSQSAAALANGWLSGQ